MYSNLFTCVLTIIILYLIPSEACKGCVSLDEYNFEKIITKFPVTLVKFDVAYPYGEKHETYSKFSQETSNLKDIIFAEVGVKDYGEKENENLATKFGVTKDDYPAILLFKKDINAPIVFPDVKDFNLDKLRTFVRDNTNIYIGLPGCIEQYDKLASGFLHSDNKEKILKQAENLITDLKEEDQISARTYMILMRKVIENGTKFLTQEAERVSKLLKEKITAKKKIELENKLNVIRAFTIPIKEEL